MEHEAATRIAMIGAGVSALLGLAMWTALLIVAVGVVRKRRPDAFGVLLAAAILGLLTTCGFPVLHSGLAAYVGREGPVAVITANAATTVLAALLGAAESGLVLFGVVRLSRQPAASEPVVTPIAPLAEPPARA
jgi:hypothetical protein